MPPEQARDAKNVDERADVYAFGATVFASLAGRPPILADNLSAMLLAVLLERPPLLSAVAPVSSPELDAAVACCLEKDPAHRPASIRAAWTRTRIALLELTKRQSAIGPAEVPGAHAALVATAAHSFYTPLPTADLRTAGTAASAFSVVDRADVAGVPVSAPLGQVISVHPVKMQDLMSMPVIPAAIGVASAACALIFHAPVALIWTALLCGLAFYLGRRRLYLVGRRSEVCERGLLWFTPEVRGGVRAIPWTELRVLWQQANRHVGGAPVDGGSAQLWDGSVSFRVDGCALRRLDERDRTARAAHSAPAVTCSLRS